MDAIEKVKRLPIGWQNVFTNHISDKELISRICKELLKLSIKKTTHFFK